MKVVMVVPYIGDASSGPAYLLPKLCHYLVQNQVALQLHTLAPAPELEAEYPVITYPRHTLPWPSIGYSPEMLAGLRKACLNADIIHSNSLWMLPNIYPEIARRGTGAHLVVSPHGCLSPWALSRSKWKKRLFGCCGQYRVLKEARLLHATCEKEFQEIRNFGLMQPVAIIPSGIDVPTNTAFPHPPGTRRRLLFLGRLHPVKGIDYLLRAWRRLMTRHPDWELLVVGPGEPEYEARLRRLAEELKLLRCEFQPEVKGSKKLEVFQSASLYVLPSHTENFGLTVTEALACGVPVVTTRGTPWRGLEEFGAGRWIELTDEQLFQALDEMLSCSEGELQQFGMRGRQWMQTHFIWDKVGKNMAAAYHWLSNDGPAPDFIQID